MSRVDNNADCQELYDLIQAHTGIHLGDPQRIEIARAVLVLLNATSLDSIPKLLLKLSNEPLDHPLWQHLIALATISEIHFFHNPSQFHALRDDILPRLIASRRSAGTLDLRCWSVGCAAGEEPYSLAILLRELLPDIDQWTISILGTDINLASLERARSGRYRAWSFHGEAPDAAVAPWFQVGAHGYQLVDTIRAMVTFAPLNLMSDAYPSSGDGTMNLDLILCRNVMNAFDPATTHEIARRFHQVLHDDGWLIVGDSESMAAAYHEFFVPHRFEETILYQKRTGAAGSGPTGKLPPVKSRVSTPKAGAAPAPFSPVKMAQPARIQAARQTVSQEARV